MVGITHLGIGIPVCLARQHPFVEEIGAIRSVTSASDRREFFEPDAARKRVDGRALVGAARRLRRRATDEGAPLGAQKEQLELKKLLQALLAGRLEPQLKGSIERMARLETLLSQTEVDPASKRVLSGRVTKLGKWRRKASGLLPWIRKFLG